MRSRRTRERAPRSRLGVEGSGLRRGGGASRRENRRVRPGTGGAWAWLFGWLLVLVTAFMAVGRRVVAGVSGLFGHVAGSPGEAIAPPSQQGRIDPDFSEDDEDLPPLAPGFEPHIEPWDPLPPVEEVKVASLKAEEEGLPEELLADQAASLRALLQSTARPSPDRGGDEKEGE